MLTCITVILLIGVTTVAWTQSILRDSLLNNLKTQAEIIADNCKASVAFDDSKDAENILLSLSTQPSIICAGIRIGENKIFASYRRNSAKEQVKMPQLSPASGYYFGDDYLLVSKGIILDGKELGEFFIESDLSALSTAFKHSVAVIAAFLTAAILVAYLLSSRLQKIISNPILALAGVAKTITEEKEYSLRATKQTQDEVGLLIDSFNEMLEQIQQRDAQLLEINVNLEEMIKERTAKLTSANQRMMQFNRLAVSRELKMIELKNEINRLLAELGREKKYKDKAEIAEIAAARGNHEK